MAWENLVLLSRLFKDDSKMSQGLLLRSIVGQIALVVAIIIIAAVFAVAA